MKAKVGLNVLISLVMLAAMFPFAAPVQAAPPVDEIPADAEFVPGEVIVMFDTDVPAEQTARAAALAGEVGGQVVATSPLGALLSFAEDADVLGLVDIIQEYPSVRAVEPNYIFQIPEADSLIIGGYSPLEYTTSIDRDGNVIERSIEELSSMRSIVKSGTTTMSIPTYPIDEFTDWGWWEIDTEFVWPETKASPIVCVLDTGVDYKHPDLYGKIINGKDYVNNDSVPNDDNGHGTHVAGIIAAKGSNKIGGIGVSNGKVLAVKVLNSQGRGSNWDIQLGIRYCANYSGAKIINMSLGGPYSGFQQDALNYAISKGRLIIASAGNDSTSIYTYAYPAAFSGSSAIISVGAARQGSVSVDIDGNDLSSGNVNYSDCATWFTNYGSWVELVAPGESIMSTTPVSYGFWMNYVQGVASGYDTLSGTSQAAPYVSGAAARLWSIDSTKTNVEIESYLKDRSRSLNLHVDGNMSSTYVDDGYYSDYPGADAPFCWPNQDGNYTSLQDMTNSGYVNIAYAMQRSALTVFVKDAVTGIPLENALVRAVTDSGITRGTVKLGRSSSTIDILNLHDYEYVKLQVSKAGYTSGYQTFARERGYPSGSYYGYYDSKMYVSVPTTMGISVVADWNWYEADNELGLYVFTPQGTVPAGYLKVIGNPRWAWNPPSDPGTLSGIPYASIRHEGPVSDGIPMESATILKKTGYNYPYYPGNYWVLLTDDSASHDGTALNAANPMIRVWSGGVIKQTWDQSYYYDCPAGNTLLAGRIYKSGTTTGYEKTLFPDSPYINCGWNPDDWPYIP